MGTHVTLWECLDGCPMYQHTRVFTRLELEDVHSLSVAGGREEHAVHAEGQGADAHTPGGEWSRRHPRHWGGHTTTFHWGPQLMSGDEGPHDSTRVYWHLSYPSLDISSKFLLKDRKCLKAINEVCGGLRSDSSLQARAPCTRPRASPAHHLHRFCSDRDVWTEATRLGHLGKGQPRR